MLEIKVLLGVRRFAEVAAETPGVAVILHHALVPRGLVQIVDVLGDDTQEHPPGLQLRQGQMGRIGAGQADEPLHLPEHVPDLGRIGAEGPDVGVFPGIEAGPEAVPAAEVGDTGFHRDAGTGQGHRPPPLAQQGRRELRGDLLLFGFHGAPINKGLYQFRFF